MYLPCSFRADKIKKIVWHHTVVDGDLFPHRFIKITDCWCEPEVVILGSDAFGDEHRFAWHQDMTGRTDGVIAVIPDDRAKTKRSLNS